MATETLRNQQYLKREATKQAAREAFARGEISALVEFEIVSRTYWESCRDFPSFSEPLLEYRCHYVRAMALAGEYIAPEILAAYPPPSGIVRIAPGCRDWDTRGVPHYLLLRVPRDLLEKYAADQVGRLNKKPAAGDTGAGSGDAEND